jgi:hypothetical protein
MSKLSSIRVYGTDFPEGESINFEAFGLDLQAHHQALLEHLKGAAESFATRQLSVNQIMKDRQAILDFMTVVLLAVPAIEDQEFVPLDPLCASIRGLSGGYVRDVVFDFGHHRPSMETRKAIIALAETWAPEQLIPSTTYRDRDLQIYFRGEYSVIVPVDPHLELGNFRGPLPDLLKVPAPALDFSGGF